MTPMRKRTNVLSLPLIAALLLTLAGCGEKAPGNKTELDIQRPGLPRILSHAELTPEVDYDALEKEMQQEDEQLRKEADAGNERAQAILGKRYVEDFDVPKDAAKALEWYLKSAALGNAKVQINLGDMYAEGRGVSKDEAKAFEWYQKAAAQGNAEAQFRLAGMYFNGEGVPKDDAKAFEWVQKAATQGHAERFVANKRRASALCRGKQRIIGRPGVFFDVDVCAEAQFALGMMYFKGVGVPKDDAKAVEWLQKAAALGNVDAQKKLGMMYVIGFGVPKDAAKAFEWYQKAAAQGDAEAQVRLGGMYDNGEGVPEDEAKTFEWYQKAAAQNYANAQFNLGLMYLEGKSISKDDAKAIEWFQKAAAQGDGGAQFRLGVMYLEGRGVTRDLARAYAWLNLAAAKMWNMPPDFPSRDIDPRVALERVEAMLTPAKRAEGQRLVANWKEGDTLQSSNDSQPGQASVGGTPRKQSTGTAFAVSTNGHALTNHHVINGCTEVKVAGREGIAKVITSDSVNDLALLQLPGKIKDIATLNPDPAKLRQGEDIIVFGYPLNAVLSSGGNLTPGTISALTGLGNNTNQIQITAPIQPGSSGSPVLDKQGNVIGVVSMKLDDVKTALATGSIPQNVNFAVNGQTVKAFLDTNKVPYKPGGGFFSREKSNADIAEEASKWSVLVECWK